MGHVLCTRPTILIPNQYARKQDGVHFSGVQMVRLSVIHMVLKTWPFGIQPLFDHSNTQLVWYSDSHLTFNFQRFDLPPTGSSWRFDRLDIFANDAAGGRGHDNRSYHFGSLPNAARRNANRSWHLLPEPHSQWNHLAYWVNACWTEVSFQRYKKNML